MSTVTGQTSQPSDANPKKPLTAHPLQVRWTEDEARQRASFVATRRALAPFLVPHRFEGNQKPEDLKRSKLGYGVGLNKMYLRDVLGHIQNAPAEYDYGSVNENALAVLDDDATGDGMPWDVFFAGKVLEWMCSSVGGLIVVDAPSSYETGPGSAGADAQDQTQGATGTGEQTLAESKDADAAYGETLRSSVVTDAQARDAGVRPYLTWVPMSNVVDCGRNRHGFRYVSITEQLDARTPEGKGEIGACILLYELKSDGETWVSRKLTDGSWVQRPRSIGKFYDAHGRAALPIVMAKHGEHPDIAWLGCGLLMGLDDIVIDLFNLMSETREAFRDAAFSVTTYNGPDHEDVEDYLRQGSRFIPLGDNPEAKLDRLAGDSAEVTAGLALVESALVQWASSAKRKSMEAAQGADPSSGVSLQAEFQLDLKPLLTTLVGELDAVEQQVLYFVAQFLDKNKAPKPGSITVERSTDFRMEDEAGRISRIVGEWIKSLPLPGSLVAKLTEKWAEATGLFDLDETFEQMPVEQTEVDVEVPNNDGTGDGEDGGDTGDGQDPAAKKPTTKTVKKSVTKAAPPKAGETLRDVVLREAAAIGQARQTEAENSGAASVPMV